MIDQPLRCSVLGPVGVKVGTRVVKIAAPRQRALLARLLLDVNRTVSSSNLIDGIWGETPPQHPESALHIVVCRLRRALEDVAPLIVSESGGYRMELQPDELDLSRAEASAVAARSALGHGDAKRAAVEFDRALGCWSGEPLADVANFPFYDVTARRLREFHLGLIESRNAAYLRCGRHLELLPDIESIIAANPWRERLRAHQMTALYRGGRQIEALAAYEDLRRLLLTDFGVDPHEDLQRLHSRILRGDPELLRDRRTAIDHADVVIADHEEAIDVDQRSLRAGLTIC